MKIRSPWLAAALIPLLPAVGWAHSSDFAQREESRQTAEARGLTSLRVENPRGLVRISPSADGRIHVTALKISRGRPTARLRDFTRDTRVEISAANGRCAVEVRYPQRQVIRATWAQLFGGELDVPRVEVRLAIEVPPALGVGVATTSGDVEVSGIGGPQSLQTTSGDLEVHDAAGPLDVASTSGDVTGSGLRRARVRTVSGNVDLQDLRGPVAVETTSGDVDLSGVADSLSVRTVSGDLRADRAPRGLLASSGSGDLVVDGAAAGAVRLRTASGVIRFGVDRSARHVEAVSSSGDIEARLADGAGYALSLASTSGTLDCTAPVRVRNVGRHELDGVVGGGGTAVVLRSVSGDIAVSGGGR